MKRKMEDTKNIKIYVKNNNKTFLNEYRKKIFNAIFKKNILTKKKWLHIRSNTWEIVKVGHDNTKRTK